MDKKIQENLDVAFLAKLDYGDVEDIVISGFTGEECNLKKLLHERDKALLAEVMRRVEYRLWFNQGHEQDLRNEGISMAVEAIQDMAKEAQGGDNGGKNV